MNEESGRLKLLTKILEMGDDQTGKLLFTDKIFLANFLKYLIPMFYNMSIKDIIEQSIDWGGNLPGYLVKSLSEEANFRSDSQLRRDFVILLRFPNYLQTGKIERFFILHVDFENSNNKVRVERKSEEYASDLYYAFNVAPYENDEERQKYHMPIYTVWILLNSSDKDKGHIHRSNYEVIERVNDEGTALEFVEVRENERALVNKIKVYVDDELNKNQKNNPNIQSLLQGISSNFDDEDFKSWLDLFELYNPEFIEEVRKVNAFEEAFVDKGIAIGVNQKLKEDLHNLKINLLEGGLCKTEDEAAKMAFELLKETEKN